MRDRLSDTNSAPSSLQALPDMSQDCVGYQLSGHHGPELQVSSQLGRL